MICLAGFILSNLKKFSHQINQVPSKTTRKRKETLMWKKWGQRLEQGVPSGGLGPMEYVEYASVFALIDIQRRDEGWTCLLTPVHRWWELRLWLVAEAGRVARFLISQLEHSKMNGLVCFSLGTAGNLSNQAWKSCEIVCVVCVHLTWGCRGGNVPSWLHKPALHLRGYRNDQAIPQHGWEACVVHSATKLTSFTKDQQGGNKLKHRDLKYPSVPPKAFCNCPPLPAWQVYPQQILLF